MTLTVSNESAARRAMETPAQKAIDVLRDNMLKQEQVDCPLEHHFIPGFYIRSLKMPKGALVVTKIHKTEHPFSITKGRVNVWSEGTGSRHLAAPYSGVTRVGTRRIIFVIEDCEMSTFHATDETDIARLEDFLFLDNESPPYDVEVIGKLTKP